MECLVNGWTTLKFQKNFLKLKTEVFIEDLNFKPQESSFIQNIRNITYGANNTANKRLKFVKILQCMHFYRFDDFQTFVIFHLVFYLLQVFFVSDIHTQYGLRHGQVLTIVGGYLVKCNGFRLKTKICEILYFKYRLQRMTRQWRMRNSDCKCGYVNVLYCK